MPNTQEHIDRVCKYRGILIKIKKGQPCNVDGRDGKIVGGNSAANFNVKFNDNGNISNCHPYWRMQIYSDSGLIIYDYEQCIT